MRASTICTVLLALTGSAAQADWAVQYQTDFSSDPGWTTNNPTYFFWNAADGTYHVKNESTSFGGYWSRIDVGHDGSSFKLDYDIKMVENHYTSGVFFGMYDSDMLAMSDNGSYVETIFTIEDRGRTILAASANASNVMTSDWSGEERWTLDTWYTVSMEYFDSTGSLTSTIRDRTTGALVGVKSFTVGPFRSEMSYVGTSGVRDYAVQTPGAYSVAYIDNVTFSTPTPVPVPGAAVLGVLGLGCAGVRLRRRGIV